MERAPHTLVLGVGNTLLCDDGAGVHALRHVQELWGPAPGLEFFDGGTLGFAILPAVERFDRWVVIDAAEMNREPGSVATFEGTEMDRFLGRPRRSAHEVGLSDLLDMARLCGRLPRRRALVGIQPESIDWSTNPSRRVTAVLPAAAATVIGIVRQWCAESRP